MFEWKLFVSSLNIIDDFYFVARVTKIYASNVLVVGWRLHYLQPENNRVLSVRVNHLFLIRKVLNFDHIPRVEGKRFCSRIEFWL